MPIGDTPRRRTVHAVGVALIASHVSGCQFEWLPAPPPPPERVPESPVDSRNSALAEGGEVVIDVEGQDSNVHLRILSKSSVLCAHTPCLTRLGPGAFDLAATSVADHLRTCNVTVQVPRKPTIVRLSVPDGFGSCGATVWSPPDGRIYQGELR